MKGEWSSIGQWQNKRIFEQTWNQPLIAIIIFGPNRCEEFQIVPVGQGRAKKCIRHQWMHTFDYFIQQLLN